jgi:hypothetical protein
MPSNPNQSPGNLFCKLINWFCNSHGNETGRIFERDQSSKINTTWVESYSNEDNVVLVPGLANRS